MSKKAKQTEPAALLKIDLGCGPNKREGFIGVDCRQFDGKVDQVVNLAQRKKGIEQYHTLGAPESDCYDLFERWPWADHSVEEAHCSHFYEHLTQKGRTFFLNELYRVMIPGGKCSLIAPHFASTRAVGDLSHEWPPIGEMHFFYLSKEWRAVNAPHDDFLHCDFDAVWGYSMRQDLLTRNQEMQQFAMANYKEAIADIVATLTAKKETK